MVTGSAVVTVAESMMLCGCNLLRAWRQFQPVPIRTLLLKGLNYTSKDEVQWQIINGSKRSSEHLPLLSMATALFREQFNLIVSTAGRDLIPVMVYGSVVVSAGLLRIFGHEVAELPLVATSKENQGKVSKYRKSYQITAFSGTSWLEKAVAHATA